MTDKSTGRMQKAGSNTLPIIAMFLLFAMISFVTNLAAPIGTIWANTYQGNSFLGMLGNMMNFLAYLCMGVPAGKLIVKIGYKKTALWAMAIGIIGLFVQWMSSVVGTDISIHQGTASVFEDLAGKETEVIRHFNVTLNFIIYLLGAFICGFCVCMLNTVANPMLNTLGGGGNKGNQLLQTGASFNSLSGALTPFLVGALIGQLTRETTISTVSPLLFIAMGVFVVSFLIILFVNIPESNDSVGAKKKFRHSPWSFRHTVLGIIGIFIYVGIEVGIPGTLNFFLADQKSTGAGIVGDASTIAGAIVAIYWLLMLVGRLCSSAISSKVSTRAQLMTVTGIGAVLVSAAICIPTTVRIEVPSMIYDSADSVRSTLVQAGMPEEKILEFFSNPSADKLDKYTVNEELELKNGSNATRRLISNSEKQPHQIVNAVNAKPTVPLSALLLILCGLCTSLMWGAIFNLAVEGLGVYTAQASGLFMMMVVGGGVLPLIQTWIAGQAGYMASYWLIVGGLLYLLYYALSGSKNVNPEIPVDDNDPQLYL